jgi:serine/threonine protein kinase
VRVVHFEVPSDHRRLNRDAKALTRLNSTHLATLLDYEQFEDGSTALVLPELDGEPLTQWLPSASTDAILGVLVHLAQGLWGCHARGFAHGSIRPEVLRVRPGPEARLHEGGLARLMVDAHLEARVEQLAGRWRAPEGPMAGPAADIYALAQVVRSVRPALPGRLGAALQQSVETDPAQRPQDAADLLSLLGVQRPAPMARLSQPPRAAQPALTASGAPTPPAEPAAGQDDGPTLVDRPSEPSLLPSPKPTPTPSAPRRGTKRRRDPSQPVAKRDAIQRIGAAEVNAALAEQPQQPHRAHPVLSQPKGPLTTLKMVALRPRAGRAGLTMRTALLILAGVSALAWILW